MTRKSLIPSIVLLAFGAAACGDYDEKNAAYEGNNAAYEAGDNAAYAPTDNAAYEAPEGNAAYPPPPADGNVTGNDMIGAPPPADPPPPANSY